MFVRRVQSHELILFRVCEEEVNIQAVLLGLDATVLPLVTTTLEVAEQIRVRLMGAHRHRMENDETRVSSVFSGKMANGERRLDHGHCLYLFRLHPAILEARVASSRVLILNPLQSLLMTKRTGCHTRGVRELYQRDGRPSVRCVVTWQGSRDDPAERKSETMLVSTTPFVPPHHWRKEAVTSGSFSSSRPNANAGIIESALAPSKVEVLDTLPGLFDID